MVQVAFDGRLFDEEGVGDLRIRHPQGNRAANLEFSGREQGCQISAGGYIRLAHKAGQQLSERRRSITLYQKSDSLLSFFQRGMRREQKTGMPLQGGDEHPRYSQIRYH